MRTKLIIFIALLGLAGCAPVRVIDAEANESASLVELSAKVERLTALVESQLRDTAERRDKALTFNKCWDSCAQYPYVKTQPDAGGMFVDQYGREVKFEKSKREQCYEKCETLRPVNDVYAGEC